MIGSEEDLIAKDDRAVGRVGGITVPLPPPSGTSITGGTVIWVAAVEVDNVSTAGAAVGGRGGLEAAVEIDGDEVPARAEGPFREVLDEEHAVGAGDNRGVQVGGRGWWG